MSIVRTLLEKVDAYLVSTGMSATAFGIAACCDPHIVRRLREGMGITARRIDKIEDYMRDNPNGPPEDRPRRPTQAANTA